MSTSSEAPLTAAEAEAIATAVALHHLRASQAGSSVGGPHSDPFGNWAREALYTSVDKSLHRLTAWGHRTWG